MAIGRTFERRCRRRCARWRTDRTGLDESRSPTADDRPRRSAAAGAARAHARPPAESSPMRFAPRAQRRRSCTSSCDRPLVPAPARRSSRPRRTSSASRPARRSTRGDCARRSDGLLRPALGELTARPRRGARGARRSRHRPVYKRVDTCAAEFEAYTPYLYSTYERRSARPAPSASRTKRKKAIILGGGPNRIGQGIEFDYCCVPRGLRAATRSASRRSWSTATPRPSPPTTTPPTGSISSR